VCTDVSMFERLAIAGVMVSCPSFALQRGYKLMSYAMHAATASRVAAMGPEASASSCSVVPMLARFCYCCCCCCVLQDENKFLVQNLVEIKMELAETQSEWGCMCAV
jgi:hypothetical protein